MIRIAIIEPVGGHGGMDFYDYGLAQGLGNNEVKVHYFTSSRTNERYFENVRSYFYFRNVWNTKNKFIRLYYFLQSYWRSLRKSKELRVSIVHLQFFDLGLLNAMVLVLVNLFGFEKVLTLHDVSSFKGENTGLTEKYILKSVDKIIVHNNLSYDELSKKLPGAKPIKIIPHGNYLPFVKELEYLPDHQKNLNLLFFGQIKQVKGLEVLLHALALAIGNYPKIHLTIAGKPWHDDLRKYEELIKSLSLERNVTTNFGYIPNEEVSRYFKDTDVVVLPYKKIYQSGVLLLSMSYGRVVLTSDLPAFKEIIEDSRTGYLFEKGNINALSNAILKIAANREELLEIKNRASKLLRTEFDWNLIGKETKEFYLNN